VQDIQRGPALESITRQIVDGRERSQCGEPEEYSWAIQEIENHNKDGLDDQDLPRQMSKLPRGSTRAEEECTLARIEAIDVGVGNVVPSVDDQPERQRHIDQSEPEADFAEYMPAREG